MTKQTKSAPSIPKVKQAVQTMLRNIGRSTTTRVTIAAPKGKGR